jgi:heme/copper-type cytochrome/quinol oxidase subunit 4
MKAVNVVLGIATAIILGALINLGIKAFYPEPISPSYPNVPASAPIVPCASNDTACLKSNEEIQAQQQAAEDQFNQQEQAYTDQINVYNRNLFIIANIIGIVMFAIGFWLMFGIIGLASNAVPVGIMLAGLWGIMYGYARGWGSVDDQLKFFIGLVIAVLVIGGSMWLIQRHQKNHPSKA